MKLSYMEILQQSQEDPIMKKLNLMRKGSTCIIHFFFSIYIAA